MKKDKIEKLEIIKKLKLSDTEYDEVFNYPPQHEVLQKINEIIDILNKYEKRTNRNT